ncbi:MAG: hypothetical protein OEZ01_10065 [Candidatus Heimdallarchaeota archaeon]|nr:hypothetical protein [Candidatus Heimdallarchaeota archaeon]MDH5646343.1 hypothetical protein [Candidatus Heimdallarchaeota archaeon]
MSTLDNQPKRGDDFYFSVKSFRKFSFGFLFLIAISFIFSLFGYMFILSILSLLFILKPKLYEKRIIPKLIRFIVKIASTRIGNVLSYFPGINFRGRCYMELNSEHRSLSSFKDIIKFILGKYVDLIIIPIGFSIFFVRISFILNNIEVSELTNVEGPIDIITNGYLFLAFFFLPIFYYFYFPIVWILEDAELKIAKWDKSSKGSSIEIHEIFYISNSFRNLMLIFFGFPAIFWAIENAPSSSNPVFLDVLTIILIIFIFIGGVGIFQGVMYYRSQSHTNLVNSLRTDIFNKYQKEYIEGDRLNYDNFVSILDIRLTPVNPQD